MKVLFDFTPEGNILTMDCLEMTTLPNSNIINPEEYYQCFKAIQRQVDDIVTMHEEKRKV